nr:GNAT family N-acetyltransferase/peptidase C39 family protein [Govania unica]
MIAIEDQVFPTDRISRRSLKRLISRKTASFLVAEDQGERLGYALVLYRTGTALARLYSIAVADHGQGKGIGHRLLEAAEAYAFDHGCIFLRLEVRADNAPAVALYQHGGYRQFGIYADYYADHASALRFEKRLAGTTPPRGKQPPYYRQSTDFTCGPACMIMAMRWFKKRPPQGSKYDRRFELKLWREATTIFMTSGVGGCEPFGMSVALLKYGVQADIWSSRKGLFFLEGLRNKERRDVMNVVQEDFRAQAMDGGIPLHPKGLDRKTLHLLLEQGGLAIVLINGYEMFRDDEPHWVLVHASDDHHVYIHDPWVEDEDLETADAASGLPIPWAAFQRMIRVGRDRRMAAIALKGGNSR